METKGVASAPASSDDKLAKLRALTDAKLDESIATFFLEMSDGNVQAAAAFYREQVGGGESAAPEPAPAPAPAPVPTPRTSIDSSSTISRTSISQGGRRRAKATTTISAAMMDTVRASQPHPMSMGPSGGLITGRRDRGFAKNSHFLDDTTCIEPRLFMESSASSVAAMNTSLSVDDAFGFSTPGAYNESEDGDGYIARERRESTAVGHGSWNSAPAAASGGGAAASLTSSDPYQTGAPNRRIIEQIYATEPMVYRQNMPRHANTHDSSRSSPPQQQRASLESSWSGRSVHATPNRRLSTMSVFSDISTSSSLLGGGPTSAEDGVDDLQNMGTSSHSNNNMTGSSRRRLSERNYATEPGLQPLREQQQLSGRSLYANSNHRVSTASTLSGFSSPSQSSMLGAGLHSEDDETEITDEMLQEMGILEATDLTRNISNRNYACEPTSGGPISPPSAEMADGSSSSHGGIPMPKSRRSTASTAATSTITKRDSASQQPRTSLEPTIFEETGHASESTEFDDRPDPPGDTIDTPWLYASSSASSLSGQDQEEPETQESSTTHSITKTKSNRGLRKGGGQSQTPSSKLDNTPARTTSKSPTRKQKGLQRTPATRPGAVRAVGDEEQPLQHGKQRATAPATQPGVVRVEAGQGEKQNAKVRRAPATKPGAVQVSAPGEPAAAEPPRAATEADSKVRRTTAAITPGAVQVSEPPNAASEADAKVRRAPAVKPGAVSVVEPPQAASEADAKVRRAPAVKPGAVAVSVSEPPEAASEADAKVRRAPAVKPGAVSIYASEPPEAASEANAKVRRTPAIKPGAVHVSEASAVEPPKAASDADAKVRRAPAVKPGAIHVSEPTSVEPPRAASDADAKVRRAPAIKPGVVQISGAKAEEPAASKPLPLRKSSRNISEGDSKVQRARATKPCAVHVSPDEPSNHSSLQTSTGLSSADTKVRRAPATVPGAVQVSQSAPDEPVDTAAAPEEPVDTAAALEEPTSSDSVSEQNSKMRRAAATKPGAVSVSKGTANLSEAAVEPSSLTPPRSRLPPPSADAADAKVRRAPASGPGAVQVSGSCDVTAAEPSLSTNSTIPLPRRRRPGPDVDDQDPASPTSCKVRRTPATLPGAVYMQPGEPLHNSANCHDAAESEAPTMNLPSGKVRHRPASQPGVIQVKGNDGTGTTDERNIKEKEKIAGLQKKATTPGVVHMTGNSSDRIAAEQSKANKFRLGPKSDPGGQQRDDAATGNPAETSKDSKAGKGLNLKPTRPGAVSVTNSKEELPNNNLSTKDSKPGKGLHMKATRPGAVSVTTSEEDLANSKLSPKTSFISQDSEDLEQTASHDDDAAPDPSLETTPVDDSVGADPLGTSAWSTRSSRNTRSPRRTRSPANAAPIPIPEIGGLGSLNERSTSPPRVMSAPIRGMPRAPVKDRRSSAEVKPKKKVGRFLGGLLKGRKSKRQSSTEEGEATDLGFEEDVHLGRIGSSRPYEKNPRNLGVGR